MSLDWHGLVSVGIGQMRIAPAVFWQLTPAELNLMLGVPVGARQSMTRGRLRQLLHAWPDVTTPAEAAGKDADHD